MRVQCLRFRELWVWDFGPVLGFDRLEPPRPRKSLYLHWLLGIGGLTVRGFSVEARYLGYQAVRNKALGLEGPGALGFQDLHILYYTILH